MKSRLDFDVAYLPAARQRGRRRSYVVHSGLGRRRPPIERGIDILVMNLVERRNAEANDLLRCQS